MDADLREELLLPINASGKGSQDVEARIFRNVDEDNDDDDDDDDDGSDGKGVCMRLGRKQKNVYVTIVLCLFWGFADALWTTSLLSVWLFLLAKREGASDENAKVGIVEAASGLGTLIFSIPIGWLADKEGIGRMPIIRIGAVFFLLATAITFTSIQPWLMEINRGGDAYLVLGGSMILWGISGGIFNGPLQALYADSVPRGKRSFWYMVLYAAYICPAIVGPGAAMIMFDVFGNNWSFEQMRPILYIGLAFEIPPAIMSFLLQDIPKHERDEEDEKIKEDAAQQNDSDGKHCCTKRAIPYILFTSEVLLALGSGMTIKFFPLFFRNEVGMSPVSVQLVYLISPLLMLPMAFAMQKVSKIVGRVVVILVARVIGISCLVAMALLFQVWGIVNPFIICPIYIFRTAIMNSSYPLEESILMDSVPSHQRAKWKTLESISVAGWAGSAFVGGALADRYGYQSTFFITAALQGIGSVAIIFLLPLVGAEKEDE